MDWEDLRSALPEDKARALRDVISETLMAYGVTIDEVLGGSVILRDAEGRGMTWQTQSVSRQVLTLEEPAAWSPARPLAELGDGTGIELRRPADRVLIVALFEPPFQAAFRRKLAMVKQKYPGWSGFGAGNAQFDHDERDYKLAAGRGLTMALGRTLTGAALLNTLAEAAKTNLLNWRLKDAFSPTERRDEQARVFAALLAHRDDAAAHPQAIAEFVEAWRALNPEGSRDTARQIAEYLLFLCRPDAAIFFKHGVLHDVYYESTARLFPSSDAASDYAGELRFAEDWRDALTDAGHPPCDLLDVQSFLWVSHGGSTAPPFQTDTPTQTSVASQPPRPKEDTAMKTLNTILCGPPGTGKTYATFRKAVEICDGADAVSGMDGNALKARYAELSDAGRIGFVTFHQSYSYEEFVEGLRPEGGADDAGFSLQPRHGALREIADLASALPDAPADQSTIEKLKSAAFYKMALGGKGDAGTAYLYEDCIEAGRVLMGWGMDVDWSDPRFSSKDEIQKELARRFPEQEKLSSHANFVNRFRNELSVGDYVVISHGNGHFRAIGRVSGPYCYEEREDHYSQARPVDWLWQGADLPRSQITSGAFVQPTLHRLKAEELKLGAIAAFFTPRVRRSEQPFVLVIDEINRANISKVFGELITLLEEDKRAGAENEVSVRLPYSGDDFTLPANLHVLGTMNTADRSIALLDTALRRRFQFEETPPRPDLLETIDGIDLPLLLARMNQRIEYLVDRDHLIGHAFFMACRTRSDVDTVMRRKVLPLLAEYFHEDWERIVAVLGGTAQGFIAKEVLNVPPGLDLGMDNARYRYTVRETFPHEAYAGLQT